MNNNRFVFIGFVLFLVACNGDVGTKPEVRDEVVRDMVDVEGRLKDLGFELKVPEKPKANYAPAVRTGNLIFLSGHGPLVNGQELLNGKVGLDLTIEEGKRAAELTALSLLSTLKAEIGDLNKVKRIVRVFGMVNCSDDFKQHPQVINGCSDLLVKIFGEEKGRHARAAVGMNSLPFGIPVEIEMIVEVFEF